MKKSLLVLFAFLCAGILLAEGTAEEEAEEYPSKNVTAIIPYDAGGGSDTITRMIDKYIQDELGVRFDFVYRTGAGGAVGATAVARAEPDGYTIGAVNIPHIVLQSITGTGDFEEEDFDYIAQMATTSLILVTPAGSDILSLDDFIEEAKARPGELTLGAPGALGDSNIAAWMLQEEAGIDFTVVNYKGGADLLSAILGGHVDAAFSAINMTIPEIESMNTLAITTPNRSDQLPDLPTFQELGYDVLSYTARIYVAPAGLPEDRYNALVEAFKGVYDNPQYQADARRANFISDWLSGPELEEYVLNYGSEAQRLIEKYYNQ